MVFGPLAFALPLIAKAGAALLPAALPSLISGGFNLFGASKASEATEAANLMNFMQAEKNLAFQKELAASNMQLQREGLSLQEKGLNTSVEENRLNRELNLGINASNLALQREFAQNGIQWRVQDAMAAGIHPLAALGGSGATYSPAAHIQGGGIPSTSMPNPVSASSSSYSHSPDTSMATALGNMGQDVSRAMAAAMSSAERTEVAGGASSVLSLENQKLQNELLKSQIARLRQTPSTPMPVNQRYLVDGQGQTAVGKSDSLIKDKAMERTPGAPHNRGVEPGAITDLGYSRTAAGTHYPVPSENVKERIEDNWYHETMHFLRNNIGPMMSNRWFKPPPSGLQQGHGWSFNPFTGYEQVPTRFHERFTGRR